MALVLILAGWLLLAPCGVSAQAASNHPHAKPFIFTNIIQDKDLVVAMPCALGEGVRTLIAINGSDELAEQMTKKYSEEHNEFYAYAPDDGEGYWGSDDDTIFFVHAAKTLLKNFDYRGLHAITDRNWFKETCVPCNFDPNNPPSGDVHGFGPSEAKPLSSNVTMVKACPSQRNYGGAGVILSKGMMDFLANNDTYFNCLMETYVNASDHLISECLWKNNIAFTDPGYIMAHGGDVNYRAFMPEWPTKTHHEGTQLARLVKGSCDYLCKWRIRNQASHHVKVRILDSPKMAAAMIVSLSTQMS
eukprot:gene3750-13810_t